MGSELNHIYLSKREAGEDLMINRSEDDVVKINIDIGVMWTHAKEC